MRGQGHTPAAHFPRERPGTHFRGGWVGSRAGLDRCGKSRLHRDSIPGPSSPYSVDIPTTLPDPPNRNEYQEYCLDGKGGQYVRLTLPPSYDNCRRNAGYSPDCWLQPNWWLQVSPRKVLRPAISTQVFSWFPCAQKQMLRRFPRFQVATTCFSYSTPDLNLVVTNFMFCLHVK